MFSQTVDLRPKPSPEPSAPTSTADRYARPVIFGNDIALQERKRVVDEALENQRSRWAVAPGHHLETHAGLFKAGSPIDLDDLDTTPEQPAWSVMERLVRFGSVLQLSEERLRVLATPADARFVVGAQALSTRRGILVPGEQITPEDVDELDALLKTGRVIERAKGGAR